MSQLFSDWKADRTHFSFIFSLMKMVITDASGKIWSIKMCFSYFTKYIIEASRWNTDNHRRGNLLFSSSTKISCQTPTIVSCLDRKHSNGYLQVMTSKIYKHSSAVGLLLTIQKLHLWFTNNPKNHFQSFNKSLDIRPYAFFFLIFYSVC